VATRGVYAALGIAAAHLDASQGGRRDLYVLLSFKVF
jgi:hypothetical protein